MAADARAHMYIINLTAISSCSSSRETAISTKLDEQEDGGIDFNFKGAHIYLQYKKRGIVKFDHESLHFPENARYICV
jgi:hypothetical protein